MKNKAEKMNASAEIKSLTSAIPVQHSYQLSYEATAMKGVNFSESINATLQCVLVIKFVSQLFILKN